MLRAHVTELETPKTIDTILKPSTPLHWLPFCTTLFDSPSHSAHRHHLQGRRAALVSLSTEVHRHRVFKLPESSRLTSSALTKFATGTAVRRLDLTIVNVEDLVVGDKLIGPDGESRTVHSVVRGRGPLYVLRPLQPSQLHPPMRPPLANGTILMRRQTGATRRVPHKLEDLARNANLRRDWRAGRPATLSFVTRTPESLKVPNSDKTVDPYILGLYLGQQQETSISGFLTASANLINRLLNLASAPSVALGSDPLDKGHPDDAKLSDPAPFKSLHFPGVEPPPWEPLSRAVFGSDSPGTIEAVGWVLSGLRTPARVPPDELANGPNVQRRVLGALLDCLGTVDVETGRARLYFEPVWPKGFKDDVMVLARCLGFGARYYRYGRNGFWDHEDKISFIQLHEGLTSLPGCMARFAKPTGKGKVKTQVTSFQIDYVRLEDHEDDWVSFSVTGPDGGLVRDDFLILHHCTHQVLLPPRGLPRQLQQEVIPQSPLRSPPHPSQRSCPPLPPRLLHRCSPQLSVALGPPIIPPRHPSLQWQPPSLQWQPPLRAVPTRHRRILSTLSLWSTEPSMWGAPLASGASAPGIGPTSRA